MNIKFKLTLISTIWGLFFSLWEIIIFDQDFKNLGNFNYLSFTNQQKFILDLITILSILIRLHIGLFMGNKGKNKVLCIIFSLICLTTQTVAMCSLSEYLINSSQDEFSIKQHAFWFGWLGMVGLAGGFLGSFASVGESNDLERGRNERRTTVRR